MERLTEETNVLWNIIICDVTWIFQYDPESMRQLMHWKTLTSPRMNKARMSRSKLKVKLIFIFDIKRVNMIKWVPEGQTIKQRGTVGKKKTHFWVMDSAPWQCTSHQWLDSEAIRSAQAQSCAHESSLFARSNCMRLLSILKVNSALNKTHFLSVDKIRTNGQGCWKVCQMMSCIIALNNGMHVYSGV